MLISLGFSQLAFVLGSGLVSAPEPGSQIANLLNFAAEEAVRTYGGLR